MKVKEIYGGLRASLFLAYFFGLLPFKRNPFWGLNYAIAPLAILFFIHIYGGGEYLIYASIGGIISVTVATTIVLETDAAFNRIVLKIQDMFVASPVGPVSYALGLALGNLAMGILGISIFVAILHIKGFLTPKLITTLLFSMTLTWVLVSSLGFLIASFAKDIKDLWTYSPIITALLSFLPPVFYPITFIQPPWLRPLAYLAPTTIAARLSQAAAGLQMVTSQEVVAMWIGLVIYVAVVLVLLVKYARWRQT